MATSLIPTALAILCISATVGRFQVQAQGGGGGSPDLSCTSSLIPCANYLNTTTKPPSSCCDPLKMTIKTQLPCLCKIFQSPELLKSLGVNMTQALELPARCQITGVSVDMCSSLSPNSAPTKPPKSPATPTSPTQGHSAADTVAWDRVSSLLIMFLGGMSVLFY